MKALFTFALAIATISPAFAATSHTEWSFECTRKEGKDEYGTYAVRAEVTLSAEQIEVKTWIPTGFDEDYTVNRGSDHSLDKPGKISFVEHTEDAGSAYFWVDEDMLKGDSGALTIEESTRQKPVTLNCK
jgi:hypothetical protein